MLDKIKRFFMDRYGLDQLNLFLVICGCIITLCFSFTRNPYLKLIGVIPDLIFLFRALSKNVDKRQKENLKFLKLSAPIRLFVTKKYNQYQDKDHKYYRCPQCHETLRVPKGKGKIKISCPHCGREFVKKT